MFIKVSAVKFNVCSYALVSGHEAPQRALWALRCHLGALKEVGEVRLAEAKLSICARRAVSSLSSKRCEREDASASARDHASTAAFARPSSFHRPAGIFPAATAGVHALSGRAFASSSSANTGASHVIAL